MMPGDPRSGRKVEEAPNREIGKPGENRGKVIAHRDSQPSAACTTEKSLQPRANRCVGQTLTVESFELSRRQGGRAVRTARRFDRNPTETERTFSPRFDRRFFFTLEAIHLAYEHEYREGNN
jgi:hypothetical protein